MAGAVECQPLVAVAQVAHRRRGPVALADGRFQRATHADALKSPDVIRQVLTPIFRQPAGHVAGLALVLNSPVRSNDNGGQADAAWFLPA